MVCMNIVARYLKLLSEDDRFSDVSSSRSKSIELLRHSLCSAFGLNSSISMYEIEYLVPICKSAILKGLNYKRWTKEYKQGVVEGSMIILSNSIAKSMERQVV